MAIDSPLSMTNVFMEYVKKMALRKTLLKITSWLRNMEDMLIFCLRQEDLKALFTMQ